MKINPRLVKVAGGYGLTTSVITIIAFLTFFYLGQQPWRNTLSLIVDVIVIGTMTFVATKDFRENENGGELRFYHGMTIGFVIYAATALIFALFYTLFMTVIQPDFLELYRQSMLEFLESRKDMLIANSSEESFQAQIDGLKDVSVSGLALDSFGKKVISGLFLAPIFSVILRTRQR
ncbi:MAG: DUF4199 domain-containing protein [Roseivirga sp.]|nr:DUF4199 domain-containing protein [Roseivirga sp.]